MFVTRNVAMKYRSPTNGDGGDGGGSGGGSGDGGQGGGDGGSGDGGQGGGTGGTGDGGQGGGDGGAGGNAGGAGGGARKVSDEEARLLKENMKKKEQLDKATSELKKAQEMLKAFDGIDPEAVKKMLNDQRSAEEKALEAKGDWDRLKTRMAEEHGKEVKTLQDQINQLTQQLSGTQNTIKDLSVGTQFSQSKFIAEELTLTPAKARVIYGDYFDVENGTVVGYDKPRGSSGRTAMVDQYGNAVGFEDALRKIVEADPEKDHLLKSKMKPGAGSDSRKPTESKKAENNTDSVSKIASGLKGLNIAV